MPYLYNGNHDLLYPWGASERLLPITVAQAWFFKSRDIIRFHSTVAELRDAGYAVSKRADPGDSVYILKFCFLELSSRHLEEFTDWYRDLVADGRKEPYLL